MYCPTTGLSARLAHGNMAVRPVSQSAIRAFVIPTEKTPMFRETYAKPLPDTGLGIPGMHAGVRRSSALASSLVLPPGTVITPVWERETVQKSPPARSPSDQAGLLPDSAGDTAARDSKVGEDYFLTDARPVVLFDGVCNLCNKWVNFLLDYDHEGKLRFASMQGDAGKQLLARAGKRTDDHSDIVFVSKNRVYIGSEAVIHILSNLALPFPVIAMLGRLVPRPIHHHLYKAVSDNRLQFFGVSDACRLFDPRFGERFLS